MMRKTRTPRSVRRVVGAYLLLLAAVAALASVALAVSATRLYRLTDDLSQIADSLGQAVELENALSAHAASRSAADRDVHARKIARLLKDIEGSVGSEAEHDATRLVHVAVDAYLARPVAETADAHTAAAAQADAEAALIEYRRLRAASVREATFRARRWDDAAIIGALAIVAFAAGVVVAASRWLTRDCVRPIEALDAAIERYVAGDRRATAAEEGPRELRSIARRFNQLAAALQRLERRRAAFVGGVAHDLRGPLAALRMSVEVLSPARAQNVDARRAEQTRERIGRQIDRMERMLWDLLDASRIEAGILELHVEENVDLRALCRSVHEMFEGASPLHELRIRVEGNVTTRCDPARMEQVLLNLVSNAIKYSPNGGVIDIAADDEGDSVVLSVSDHGVGIAAEDQARLFQPFQRAGLSGEGIPGVGLGLFVVKSIVDAHGGAITLESTLGAGSTFRVRLPKARAGVAVSPASPELPASPAEVPVVAH